MSRYIYSIVPLAVMCSELLFRVLNRNSTHSMRIYWTHRLYQILSLIPFNIVGVYITKDSNVSDEVLLSNLFLALTIFALFIVSIIQDSYKRNE